MQLVCVKDGFTINYLRMYEASSHYGMPLHALLQNLSELRAAPDVWVNRVINDSRLAEASDLFIAYAGYGARQPWRSYIQAAYDAGARHFVVASDEQEVFAKRYEGAFFYGVEDLPTALAEIAMRFYRFPARDMRVIGVTGTNGKTTTSFVIAELLERLGMLTGLIGTIEYRIASERRVSHNTTPDSLLLAELLAQMRDAGVGYVVMELSSHALALGRLLRVDLDAVLFTNFSQDHLDFHGSMESYMEAKQESIHLLARSSKEDTYYLMNVDGAWRIALEACLSAYPYVHQRSFSLQGEADFAVRDIQSEEGYTSFALGGQRFCIAMPGVPNVYNFAMAASILRCFGWEWAELAAQCMEITVPGRMDPVRVAGAPLLLVDYAHTPDAIQSACAILRGSMDKGRLILVFGAGGDRDSSKRPLMGQAAQAGADILVLTSDNPRTEDPMQIIRDVQEGISEEAVLHVEVDRAQGIREAIRLAHVEDVVLVVGKGHETYQIIGHEKRPFSDKVIALEILQARVGAT